MNDNSQTSFPHLRLGVLHYHWLRCGVTTVVNNALRAVIAHIPCDHLEIDLISSDANQPHSQTMIDDLCQWATQVHPGRCSINPIELPQLAYHDTPANDRDQLFTEAGEFADTLLNSLALHRSTVDNPYVLHLHNTNLGKNPRLTLALKLLADRLESEQLPAWILYQIHDFAEDNRPACWAALKTCSGTDDPQLAIEMMYPVSTRIHWATINSADRRRLLSLPVLPEGVTVLPNAVDSETFAAPALSQMSTDQLSELSLPPADYARDLTNRISHFAQANGYCFGPVRKILLAPIKILRRKNVAESILLLQALNHQDDCWQLLITLGANSPADITYSQALGNFVRQHQLPVTIGFGSDVLKAGHQRIIEDSRVLSYSLIDMLALADAVVTTSVQEGFGYVFHEPWLAGKPLIGRNIPRVTADFTAEGMQLDHLYDHLLIPKAMLGTRWDDLRQTYVEKLNPARAAMGLDPYPAAEAADLIDRRKTCVCPPDNPPDPHNHPNPPIRIDFADLDLSSQLYILQQVKEDPSLLLQLLWTDASRRPLSHWSNTDISDIIDNNREIVTRRYNLELFGRRLAALFEDGCRRVKDAAPRQPSSKRSNEAILAESLAIDNLRLLA